jgi:hypothetical protein
MPNFLGEPWRCSQDSYLIALRLYPTLRIKERPQKNRHILISRTHYTTRHSFVRRSLSKFMSLPYEKLIE